MNASNKPNQNNRAYPAVGVDPFLTQNTHLSGRVARVYPDSPRLLQNAKAGRTQAKAGRTQGSPLHKPKNRRGHHPDMPRQNAKAALLVLIILSACVPVQATQASQSSSLNSIASLVVNPNGDAVCVAANSSMAAVFSRAAIRGQTGHGWFEAPLRISSVAWYNNAWWLALPRAGLVQRAEGVPQSLGVAGQPSLLSSRFIFTLEGDVFRFDGTKIGRVPSLPSSVLDLPSSTFALVGKEIYVLSNAVTRVRQLENNNFSLVADQNTYAVVRGQAVRSLGYTYTLDKSTVQVSSNEQPIKTIILSSTGSSLAVGGDTLAVAVGSSVAFFDARSFVSLMTRACLVTR